MRQQIIFLIIILVLAADPFFAQEKNEGLIAIKGCRIIPVVGEDIPSGTILVKGGLIEAIGADVAIPKEAKVIEAAGLWAYPGMIDGCSTLGLSEISSIQATQDSRETGRINPQVRAVEALRPDSIHIPITRANGITAALVAPSGGLIAGQSGLIRLDGWTPQELVIKSPMAMHVEFPPIGRASLRREAAPREESSRQVEELKDLLNKARFYQKRKEAAQKNLLLALPEFDDKLEALIPVANGELPLMISVYGDKDIRVAIKFVQDEKLKAIFFGVTQGWKVAEEIKKSGIPVVFGSLYDMPPSWEDGYDALFRNPGILNKAGVKIAFSSQSASLAKELPFHAAKAAAFGLDKREALKGVTINPAQIFGIDKLMGSLEKSKVANIVLTDGDLLELRTNIRHVLIDGREVDLSNKFTELVDKFKKRG